MAVTNWVDTATLSNLVIPAYDRLVEFELRETPTFRSIVDRRPTDVTNPGDTVHFTWHKDLTPSLTPLQETVTPDSLAVSNPSRTSVTIDEFGAWVPKTIRLRKTAFTRPDLEVAELLARHQGDTLDALVRAKLDAGTNVLDLTGGSSKLLHAAGVRLIRNKMRSAVVPFKDGANYVAHVHPDCTHDLMAEAGENVWHSPHTYGGDTSAIYAGEVGKYSAVRFVENTRCKVTAPATGVAGTYLTYVVGRGALVEAVSVEPHTVIGPQTDALRRHFPVGWYGMLGWALHRKESLLVVKSESSLAPAK